MKALVVVPYYYPKIGGLENYARQLNLALSSRHKWEIVVVSSNSTPLTIASKVDGQKIYRLGTLFKLSNTPFNFFWARQIRGIINTEKPDLIIAHAPVPSLADVAARAKGDTPYILVYHAATLYKQGAFLFNLAARCYQLYGHSTMRRADRIWAVSDYVREQLPLKLQSKTSVLYNSVWGSELSSRRQPSKPRFVFIASLDRSHAWKGLDEILQALAIYRNKYGGSVELTVIGDGNARPEYEKQAVALGISSNVNFRGPLVGDEKVKELRRALALIIYPTTSNDAFPTVLLEAWAQQVPVIAAASGPIPSLISDKKDGILCEASNPEALAASMHELVTLPYDKRLKLVERASRRVKNEYTWEKQARTAIRYAGELV